MATCSMSSVDRLFNKNVLNAYFIYRNMLRGNERKKISIVWAGLEDDTL